MFGSTQMMQKASYYVDHIGMIIDMASVPVCRTDGFFLTLTLSPLSLSPQLANMREIKGTHSLSKSLLPIPSCRFGIFQWCVVGAQASVSVL